MTSPPPDDRKAKALELHLAGASYQTIADQLGYASKASAHKIVQQALVDLGAPGLSDDEATTELARLDAMLTGLWPKARRGDVQAVDRVLRIQARREWVLGAASRAEQSAEATATAEATEAVEDEVTKARRQREQARQAAGLA